MRIDSINLNNLRVFECVFRARCMTTASKELHLTQSGVSQHIKSLEETLGVQLFDRIGRKIVPTESGEKLFLKTKVALLGLEEALGEVTKKETSLRGTVRLGLPIEFGNNVIVPILSRLGRKEQRIKFELTLDFAAVMNEKLLKGELDFAIVDEYSMDKRLTVEKLAEETLELVGTKMYLKSFQPVQNTSSYYERLSYISYQAGEHVLRSWFAHHIKRKNLELNVRAQVMDVQGVSHFILNHLGVGVVPNHLVERWLKEGIEVQVLKGSGRSLKNKMGLAYFKERSRGPAVQCVIEEILKST